MKNIYKLMLGLCALPLAACSPSAEQGDAFYTMKNKAGMEVTVTNFGGRITSVLVPDRDGVKRDVVLGFDKVEDYYPENHQSDFGATIGRYANRIAEAKFTLDGKEYELPKNNFRNCLHGGPTGWQYQPYKMVEADASHVKFRIDSPDGDNGFPGAVTAFVTFTLTEDNKIDISYSATTTAPTVINMTNHSYFNLSGNPTRSIVEDSLYVNASEFTPIDRFSIPLGENVPVAGTPMDFTAMQRIGDRINDTSDEQIRNGSGYDHNWVLDTKGDVSKVAATLYCPLTGIAMDVYTDEPGVQVYTGNFLDGSISGKGGVVYQKRAAICLETQHYPDSPNRPQWPSTVLRPGETYTGRCIYAFYIR